MDCSMPGLPFFHHFPELAQTQVHWVGDATQPSHPLLSPSPPAFNLSQHKGCFQWVISSHPIAKVLQLQHQSLQRIFRTDFFRMDWLDLLAVQGILKSLLQHPSSKASILQLSAFFTVQLSHAYMTTRKNIALTRWTYVGQVMSLFFNKQRFVIAFFPRNKCLNFKASVSSAYLRLLLFLLAILIPACASSSPAFHTIYSTYKLNKQGDNIQPWCTPFPIWNQSVVPWPFLTVASWLAYRFHRRQVRWSGIPISLRIFQFVVMHIVKGFSIVNEAEIDVFLEFSCFFYDPTDVGILFPVFKKMVKGVWCSLWFSCLF